MHYLLAFQILCGFFSAYVAGRKGRSRPRWWCAGALLPVVGVVLALVVDQPRGYSPELEAPSTGGEALHRPRRCSGEFIADCLGCPYFRRRLFGSDSVDAVRGYCEFFARELLDEERSAASG